MIIDKFFLNQLSLRAKENPRLRQGFDLRNSENDTSQRLLNALEPGTVMPIHRHTNTSETVVIISGRLKMKIYDEGGNLLEEVLMIPEGNNPIIQIEKNCWHSLECLETGTVIFESKDCKYKPLTEIDIMQE